MVVFQNNSRLITLLCCCSELAAGASVVPTHTSPSVPIISSSSSSIIRHLEWSWKLAFHPGVMGNTRPSTPGSRFAPYALRAPHPRGRVAVYGLPCSCARRYAPASLRLLGSGVGGTAPLLRGDPASRSARPPLLDRPGLAAPRRFAPPPAGDYTYGLLLVMGCAAGV